MRSASFLCFLGLVIGIQGCFFGDDDVHRSSSGTGGTGGVSSTSSAPACSESRPQILALDMQPSATVGAAGDYEISGTIRSSCSAVTVEAHVFDPDGYVRWVTSPSSSETKLSLRFAASQKGDVVQYEISTYDAQGNESWPPLRQSVTLE